MSKPHRAPTVVSRRRGIDSLAKALKLETIDLRKWRSGTPSEFTYVTFPIPKRDGRQRWIDRPNDELMNLQRRVYSRLLSNEAYQAEACGFVPRRSIIDNVRPHLHSQIIIKIDLKDFFHNTRSDVVLNYWRSAGWDDDASTILTNIVCKDGHLPQGSPTSPSLSNVVNRGFDGELWRIAQKYSARYTRYADDLTFSFPLKNTTSNRKVRPMLDAIREQIIIEGYNVQWSKGIKILRRHQRQIVTGLVINADINLPRRTRRLIRALKHQRSIGQLSDSDCRRLEGYENLERMLNRRPKPARRHVPQGVPWGDLSSVGRGVPSFGGNLIMNNPGDIVFGNQSKAGDNFGGIQNVGGFQTVASSLNNVGHTELAKALSDLVSAIETSPEFDPVQKKETIAVLGELGEEVAKNEPSKTKISVLWSGLQPVLSTAADVVKVAATVGTILGALLP